MSIERETDDCSSLSQKMEEEIISARHISFIGKSGELLEFGQKRGKVPLLTLVIHNVRHP
jgi:hypothetical protein